MILRIIMQNKGKNIEKDKNLCDLFFIQAKPFKRQHLDEHLKKGVLQTIKTS